jgi:thymidine phosphorylase
MKVRIGDEVSAGSVVATIHFNESGAADEAEELVSRACVIGPERAAPPALIKGRGRQ